MQFAKQGAKLVVNYLKSEEEVLLVADEIKQIGSDAIALQCDVFNEEQVKKMIDKIIKTFKRLDILVNNAGSYIDGDEWNGSSDIWEKTLKQDLISAMITSKYSAEIFQKQKNGIIVNIASHHSLFGQVNALAYAASKAGIVSITQAYAKLLAPFGRANSVSPGAVNAGYWLRASKEEIDDVVSKMSSKKLIEPDEIASVVLFLTSDDSARVNGQNVLVDDVKR